MAIKLGRVVTYNKELPSIKSHPFLSHGLFSDFDFSYTICTILGKRLSLHQLLALFALTC